MKSTQIALAVISIGAGAAAQVALKAGMSSATVQAALQTRAPGQVVVAMAGNVPLVGGLLLYVLSALLWLLVLARTDLSQAYPFVALGTVLVLLASAWRLHEPLETSRVLGTALIALGVLLVARG
jgi:drug/metabolite transporter (DMT)-like permease